MNILCFYIWTSIPLSSKAQSPQIDVKKETWTLIELITYLEYNYSINFSYSSSAIDTSQVLKFHKKYYSLDGLIVTIEAQSNTSFLMQDEKILIRYTKGHSPKIINGYVSDRDTGERLIGVTIRVVGQGKETWGTTSNLYGFYSLTVLDRTTTLEYTYLGYEPKRVILGPMSTSRTDITMSPRSEVLDEVVVLADTEVKLNTISSLGLQRVASKFFNSTPAMVGERDIMKSIQTIPGVTPITEGSSGISVRGGGRDQNLIMLDEAPVYNPAHLFGFYSIFNADAIKDLKIYKGQFPAKYGGRASSVLDIHMKEGNNQKFSGAGGIGLISSRIALEGPLTKGKNSFLITGRRSYADLFLKLDPNDGGNNVNFYDLNAKLNVEINKNNHLHVSGYFGRDLLRFYDQYESRWGNATSTIRWNHVFSSKLFANTSLIYSDYFYNIKYFQQLSRNTEVDWESGITDINIKSDFEYYLNQRNTISFGINGVLHHFEPGKNRINSRNIVPDTYALESSFYLSNDQTFSNKIKLTYGIRLVSFASVGNLISYAFDKNYQVIDTLKSSNGFRDHQLAIEPRFTLKYTANKWVFVTSYTRTNQFIQTLSNASFAFSAFDIHLPTSRNIAPVSVDLLSIGMQKALRNDISLSVDTYYKYLDNILDYRDHAKIVQNPFLEGELRSGTAIAYGIECSLEKTSGHTTGLLGYTYSRSFFTVPEINGGNRYPSIYDRPHQIQVSLTQQHNQKWTFNLSWNLSSGIPVTYPQGNFIYGSYVVPIYGERNSNRLPVYHRLDLSAKLTPRKNENRRYKTAWLFSLYNAYYRINPVSINFALEENNFGVPVEPLNILAEKTYLLGIIPSVSYEFKF